MSPLGSVVMVGGVRISTKMLSVKTTPSKVDAMEYQSLEEGAKDKVLPLEPSNQVMFPPLGPS